MLVRHDRVALRSAPSLHAPVLATLIEQTQVQILNAQPRWDKILLWDSIQGWIRRVDLTTRRPWPTVSTYRAPEVQTPIRVHGPTPVEAGATVLTRTSVLQAPGGRTIGLVLPGASVRVTAFQQDSDGRVWYRAAPGWIRGDGIRFTRGNAPGQVWRPVTGKGMWLTLGVIADTAPDILVRAARHNGVTHLYLEAAISPLGFHGRFTVGPLIDAAHRAHISVIAWVYPYLLDVAGDVRLTMHVASFRTETGGRFDGIAADLERNIAVWNVRAYGQLVRALAGPRYLLIGVTYPPQSSPDFPFAEVAASFDVLAPMDYWHQTRTPPSGGAPYDSAYGYRYAVDSIAQIRVDAGRGVAVAPIGQTFDNFGHLEMGPNAPSSGEIQGFLRGCKHSKAIGVSFFQWMTATSDEWRAIHDFHY